MFSFRNTGRECALCNRIAKSTGQISTNWEAKASCLQGCKGVQPISKQNDTGQRREKWEGMRAHPIAAVTSMYREIKEFVSCGRLNTKYRHLHVGAYQWEYSLGRVFRRTGVSLGSDSNIAYIISIKQS